MAAIEISAREARRIAIGAQGLDAKCTASAVDVRHIRRVIRRMGLLQLDFVNVLVPAHYLVVYSRTGAYRRETLERLVYGRGEFLEQWAHEASIVPVDAWPLLAYRRESFKPWRSSGLHTLKERDKYLSQIIEIIEEKGALTAHDLPQVKGPRRKPGDWHRPVARSALEYHFGVGALAVSDRRPNFQRVYDLAHRVVDESTFSRRIPVEDAQRELLRRAAVACGVATLRDIADYYRMPAAMAAPRIRELVEEGELSEVRVEGWIEQAYLARGSGRPRNCTRHTLLSPFDPLVWFRPRAERLFDFFYRIEIYVPEHKRRWGYYVLPFLMGDALVARVDLKAERPTATLCVRAAYLEDNADKQSTAIALASELRALASWLGLESVKVGRKGNLALELGRACRAVG